MQDGKTSDENAEKGGLQRYRVRLPGLISEEDVGLGDLIKRVTHAFGIRPCGVCERRATALNRRLVFSNGGHRR